MGKRALAAAGALVLLLCLALPVAGDEEGASDVGKDDVGADAGKPAGKGLREEVDVETRRVEAIAKLEKPLEKMRVKVSLPPPSLCAAYLFRSMALCRGKDSSP